MGMTMAQKILAQAGGKEHVRVSEIVTAHVDVAMTHDAMGPLAFRAFEEIGADKLWDPGKVYVHIEHSVPPIQGRAELGKITREFARKHRTPFYDVREGICFFVMIDNGHVHPSLLVLGTDSHTCTMGAVGAFATGVGSSEMGAVLATGTIWLKVPPTFRFDIRGTLPPMVTAKDIMLYFAGQYGTDMANYRAIEYAGETVSRMGMDGRITLCNMAVELGAKTGMVTADEVTVEFFTKRGITIQPFGSDADAEYEAIIPLDVSSLEPQVACPHDVGNVKPVGEVSGTKIDQAVLGLCTNGRYDDIKLAYDLLNGHSIHPSVRFYIFPNTKETYLRALEEGMIERFTRAGGIVGYPSCGSCVGYVGALCEGEVCISSQNRNFKGRIGSPGARIYLGSPATVVASAIKGEISDPRELL